MVEGPPSLPAFNPFAPGRVSIHATAVEMAGRGLLILGPSGSGKSGLAAQLIRDGAGLVADDLVIVTREGPTLMLALPKDGPCLLELRGIGLAPMSISGPVVLHAALILGTSAARMPDPGTLDILGIEVPLMQHPYRFDLAAKLGIWLARRPVGEHHSVSAAPRAIEKPD
ncbi:MAG: serine kinase [Jannaschia sp.]